MSATALQESVANLRETSARRIETWSAPTEKEREAIGAIRFAREILPPLEELLAAASKLLASIPWMEQWAKLIDENPERIHGLVPQYRPQMEAYMRLRDLLRGVQRPG